LPLSLVHCKVVLPIGWMSVTFCAIVC
jgi:hypothetical protein